MPLFLGRSRGSISYWPITNGTATQSLPTPWDQLIRNYVTQDWGPCIAELPTPGDELRFVKTLKLPHGSIMPDLLMRRSAIHGYGGGLFCESRFEKEEIVVDFSDSSFLKSAFDQLEAVGCVAASNQPLATGHLSS